MDDTYATKDLQEAAYMYSHGNPNFPRPPMDWEGCGRNPATGELWFHFSDVSLREQQHDDGLFRTVPVNLFLQSRGFSVIKRMIHDHNDASV